MTKQKALVLTEAPANTDKSTGVLQIEVTPEMIEAGVAALNHQSEGLGLSLPTMGSEILVSAILLASLSAIPAEVKWSEPDCIGSFLAQRESWSSLLALSIRHRLIFTA